MADFIQRADKMVQEHSLRLIPEDKVSHGSRIIDRDVSHLWFIDTEGNLFINLS